MASSTETIRIGYVPEHYLGPLHLALRSSAAHLPFEVRLVPFPSGTGHMITSLRDKEIDLAIGLTEGWVAGLVGKQQAPKDSATDGYKIVGHWVDTPLRWAIVTGRERAEIHGVEDLKGGRVGVSRLGSGSHIMSFVLSQTHHWSETDTLTPTILGPFGSLRDGVTGSDPASSSATTAPTADFFMWEEFTTKPYFRPTADHPHPPLKKIGEIYTPWPSWMIVASTATFAGDLGSDARLARLFEVLDQGIAEFEADRERVVTLLGTGELGCTYGEEDAREWMKDVRFTKGTRGVQRAVVDGVVDVLKVAGVIDGGLENEAAFERLVGIAQ
ncbi:hypothetical protein BO86DRAFT_386608 [Aspergillus japonicus CBS 114.51]|uniref:Ca3427-like PBP 2 domain-containing protein n=2 Tax=Aspergillus TaxID=5052 RepID=A0A2V5HGN4_ASPV1|nr:hypothetical protein BO86DRAFT_386608 [Aspergillus japonicus CBS 114.51]PYI22921.1 hypothetical protein BO99DRAFT_399651 [Aspergillus violaceofuscus CBS 115571]RAH85077.1 hypothetical protein BO86DRAFT_386608 [Aspergillus japonicus CBS 114.51]